MSASTGTTSPTTLPALSPNDVILQHVMTLIGDDGTVFDILQHVGVQSPLDLFMYNEDDFANMKTKINNKNTPIPFRCQKPLMLFKKFHIYRQLMQLPHQPDD